MDSLLSFQEEATNIQQEKANAGVHGTCGKLFFNHQVSLGVVFSEWKSSITKTQIISD